ncbi:MAG: Non-canonical purine NTP pyrophosphatase [candidate division WS2 bacterium ADurb.Bin280]|uniref:Non-canonical purine NTP pyrophosphatase n=1 Tax=candidate division WS2 bacterium ADurb.Bin280 TaxID=1852829 RepID=A0A1V5SDF1_9BACT|nr:MAG: Non-canonical purine NTP pyrophosphatase [candidate division WS2 bacterium ADurb.Bin280]
MKKIYYVTGNEGKFKEFKRLVKFEGVSRQKADIAEIQSLDLVEIVAKKARDAYQELKNPVIVEDTSLVYNAFGRLPGPFVKYFESELGHSGMCRILNHYKKDRTASVEVMYGYFDGKNLKTFSAITRGRISAHPKGERGFSWDTIFIPDGSKLTFAQMTAREKDRFSPRKIAADKLSEFLNSLD